MTTAVTIPIGRLRYPLVGLTTHLLILTNTGSAPVLISTAPGDPLDGVTLAVGETHQLQGRTLWLTSEDPTTVEYTKLTLDDLRANAAEEFGIPVELLADARSMAEIADFVVRFTARERGEL